MEESLRRLRRRSTSISMQVHNLIGVEAMIPLLLEWKKAGRIGYYGITTSNPNDHGRMMDYMRRLPMDFIQVDYSLANRSAAQEVLPLAIQKGIAVIADSPFGGRRAAASMLFAQVVGKPLPDWAAAVQITSWSQLFLKYVVSHPAITCADPGTTTVGHLADNMAAAHGAMPDAPLRQKDGGALGRPLSPDEHPVRHPAQLPHSRTLLIRTVARGRPAGSAGRTCQLIGCGQGKSGVVHSILQWGVLARTPVTRVLCRRGSQTARP